MHVVIGMQHREYQRIALLGAYFAAFRRDDIPFTLKHVDGLIGIVLKMLDAIIIRIPVGEFGNGRILHSHLRMTGAWGVHREGARWIIEVKMDKEMSSEDVKGKREAARRREDVPEIGPLRAALEPLVRAERGQRHPARPGPEPGPAETLLASVYHLIDRGRAADYRALVEAGGSALAPRRVTVSGPFAPYAFAPEDLT